MIAVTSHTMAHASIIHTDQTLRRHAATDLSMIEFTSCTVAYALIKCAHHTKPRHVVESAVSTIEYTSHTMAHALIKCAHHTKSCHVVESAVSTIEYTSHTMAHALVERITPSRVM
jgi:hypothetical protein